MRRLYTQWCSDIIVSVERPEEIFEKALALPAESHERWDQVVALQRRGDRATFEAAAALLESPDPATRTLAIDVLAQLGFETNARAERRRFAAPAATLLLHHLPTEENAEVVASIGIAFGHLRDPRCIPALRALRDHRDPSVRYAVVFGLSGIDDDLAVRTLIELSADEAPHVRDWATFGLGTQIDRDDPAVRDSLIARLNDPDVDTRGEAIRGLANRGDTRTIPQLLQELNEVAEHPVLSAIEEALLTLASKSADARLCDAVRAMQRDWQENHPDDPPPRDLHAAITACNKADPANATRDQPLG